MSGHSASDRPDPSRAHGAPCARRRVLVVDADADNRELYCDALRSEGCTVVDAADGRQALTEALACAPAIVITELRLPVLSGYDLCAMLRRDHLTATVPIVVVTAEAREAQLADIRRIGVSAVFVKPTMPDVLISAVRRLLSPGPRANVPIADPPERLCGFNLDPSRR